MAIALPDLPYAYDALEPVISAATLKLHHGAHHRTYVDKLNALVKGSELEALPLEDIVRRSAWAMHSTPAMRPVFNNAAQAWNHAFYWRSLRPKVPGGRPEGALAERIDAAFGSHERFKELFKAAAMQAFGSGWVWLVDDGGVLEISVTSNADTPLVHKQRPLLVLDVWEHAYYLDYQSRRVGYVDAAVDLLLDWEFAERNYAGQDAVHA
ncbi:MAG TPA: superoxide dismutase [Burkholderiales bacterium]|nr:superoxide dismutase [Burkholderiales bacterium]